MLAVLLAGGVGPRRRVAHRAAPVRRARLAVHPALHGGDRATGDAEHRHAGARVLTFWQHGAPFWPLPDTLAITAARHRRGRQRSCCASRPRCRSRVLLTMTTPWADLLKALRVVLRAAHVRLRAGDGLSLRVHARAGGPGHGHRAHQPHRRPGFAAADDRRFVGAAVGHAVRQVAGDERAGLSAPWSRAATRARCVR